MRCAVEKVHHCHNFALLLIEKERQVRKANFIVNLPKKISAAVNQSEEGVHVH